MNDSYAEIFGNMFKRFLPLLCSALLVIAAYIPIHIPLSKFLRPDLGMICVYFWALYRQDLFGPFSVFVLGLIADSMSAVPTGLNIFVFVFIYVLASTFGSYVNTKPFAVSWIGFAVISLLAFTVKWLLASFYYSRFLAIGGITAGYAATVLLYPLVVRFNIFIQNKYMANEEVVYEKD